MHWSIELRLFSCLIVFTIAICLYSFIIEGPFKTFKHAKCNSLNSKWKRKIVQKFELFWVLLYQLSTHRIVSLENIEEMGFSWDFLMHISSHDPSSVEVEYNFEEASWLSGHVQSVYSGIYTNIAMYILNLVLSVIRWVFSLFMLIREYKTQFSLDDVIAASTKIQNRSTHHFPLQFPTIASHCQADQWRD